VAFIAYQLFRIPIIIHRIYSRGSWRINQEDMDYSILLCHLKITAASLIPVGVMAGLLTITFQTLREQTLSTQMHILGSLSGLFILSYPTLEVYWYILSHQKQAAFQRRKTSEEFRTTTNSFHKLCDLVGFPRKDVLIAEGSSAATFYFGFLFYRKIAVFFNDPIHHSSLSAAESSFTPKEAESILAHELGHWYEVHSDSAVLLWHARHISTAIVTYWLHSSPTLLNGFGFRPSNEMGVTSLAAFCLPGLIIAYYLILRPYYYILEIIYNFHQRASEREADHFAASLGYESHLSRSLIKLELKQYKPPSDDPFYSRFYHQHPCLVERLQLLLDTSLELDLKNKNYS